MVTTVLGSNSYAVQRKVAELVISFQREHDDSIERFDAVDRVAADDVIDAVRSISLLDSKKMVIVKNLSAAKHLLEALDQILQSVADSTHLVLVDSSPDRRSAAYKQLKKETTLYEYFEPTEIELVSWVRENAAEQGVEIDASIARYVVDRVGLNQQLLAQEIRKLSSTNKPLSRELIDELVELTPHSKIFTMLESLFRGNLKKTLELYEDQRRQGAEPQKIIGMIIWQLEQLTLAAFSPNHSLQALTQAGMSPYSARKSLELSRGISQDELREYISELASLDAQSKTNADSESALTVFFATVSRK